MYYSAEIQEMMKISKETNEPVISRFNEETFCVKYSEQFDDYTFQYSWIIQGNESIIQQKVHDDVNNFLLARPGSERISSDMDVIQMGLISVYNTNADDFIEVIKLVKKKRLEQTRETKYVFFGKKVLSVVQYYGRFSNPFECMDSITKWSNPDVKPEIQNLKLIKLARGIYCGLSKENDSIIFSIGCKYTKTIFCDKISKTIPPILCIDSIKGITEFKI